MTYTQQRKQGYPRTLGEDYFTIIETDLADEYVLSEAAATAFYLPTPQVVFYMIDTAGTTVAASATMTFRLYNKVLPTTTTYLAYGTGTIWSVATSTSIPIGSGVITAGSGWYKLVCTSAANKIQIDTDATVSIYYKAI